MLALHGGFFDFIGDLDFGMLGYAIVGIFLRAWGPSFALWRFDHIEARYFRVLHTHSHENTHASGIRPSICISGCLTH